MKNMVTIHNPEQNRIAEVHTSSVETWTRRGWHAIEGSIRGEGLAQPEEAPSDETPSGESEAEDTEAVQLSKPTGQGARNG